MVQLYKSSAINVVASLFRSARLFTRSEFHSTSLPVKRHSTFHKQILPLSPCQGTSNFQREANFTPTFSLSRGFQLSTRSEFTSSSPLPKSARLSTRSVFHPTFLLFQGAWFSTARSNSFFPSAEGRMKG